MTVNKDHSLKRQHKLLKTDDFSSVFDFKNRHHSRYFVLHYKPNVHTHARIGFVIGKKVAKSSVKRNYMRRVLRELFRTHSLRDALHYDLVVRVTRQFNDQDFEQIQKDFLRLFNRLTLPS